ncbi:MAG: hypothetical protein KUL88_11895, partial [Rhizobium sp.]|nr:hypothetical protein [Rhizobium sp.]
VGAAAGGAFAGLGRAGLAGFEKIMAYGMTGGVTSVMGGGNFQSGFLAAGFSALAGPYIDAVANDNVFAGAAASSVVGGAASVLGGGKFENGAVTGAFTYAVGKFARELNAHEAYNSKFAGPGATIGRRWTTLDFVKHYFLGHGEAVRLVDVGLADDFRNSSSVKAVTGKFIEDTLGRAYPGYTVDGIDTSDVTREPGLFSVGHSSLFMGAGCGVSTCTFNFEIKDWFRDPLDLGVEIVGGTPYPINDNWIAIQPYGRQQ